SFDPSRPNLAISMAEFLLTMFLADGRSQIAFFANGATPDSALYRCMEELLQLWMEGGQKRGAPLASMQALLLPHQSHKTLEDVADPAHVGLSIDDVPYGLGLGNDDRISQLIPTIHVELEQPTLETAAALSTLSEDLGVYYAALTGQDPNSNPEVAQVRRLGS